MIRRCMALLLTLMASVGCTTRMGDFTVASSKNIPTRFDVKRNAVSGEDCALQVLGIPIGTLNPTIDGAVDDAIAKVPGADALTDVALFQDLRIYVLFNKICVRVEGKAVSTR